MYRGKTRRARRAALGAVVVGAFAAVFATQVPAEAGMNGPVVIQYHPDVRVATAAPNLAALQQSLQAVVGAGAPGVFARVDDQRGAKSYTVSAGTGDIATRAPVDTTGEFRVGSITKNFTAVLVLQLVSAKKVNLDTAATQYLPAGVLPAGSGITVRELLDHTSGLYDYTNDLLVGDTVTGYQKFRYLTYQPQSLVARALAHGSQSTPGSTYSYSNTNFVVLGMLVEHMTGLPYATALKQEILTPLGLTHTSFVVPTTTIAGSHAIGYLTQDDRTKPLFDATNQTASWLWTAGALISSTADLNHYFRALTTGQLLPAAQLAEMETTEPVDATSRYGLGMREYLLSCGVDVYGHDGIIEGYQTYSYTTLNGSRQVTVSANASNNSDVFAAERQVLDPVFCGAAPSAAARRLSTTDAGQIAREESAGQH